MSIARRERSEQTDAPESIDRRLRALVASCGITAALIAGSLFAMSSSALGEGSDLTEVQQAEKSKVAAEWVWERKAKSFDYMWRVPR